MALGQFVLDGFLVAQEPVHGPVEFVNLRGAQLLGLAQGGALGVSQVPGQGQFAAGVQDPAHDHGQD